MLKTIAPPGGFARAAASQALRSAGLPELFAEYARGDFGPMDASALRALELLRDAVDTGMAAREAIHGVILEHVACGPSLNPPPLTREQARLLAIAQLIITADVTLRHAGALIALAAPTGQLDLDGLPQLLDLTPQPEELATRWLGLGVAYARMKLRVDASSEHAALEVLGALCAFLQLGRKTLLMLCTQSSVRPLVRALEREGLEVAGYPYEGLQVRSVSKQASAGLLPVRPQDIVGNEAYVEAGLKLARDVAGFDFELGRNPKRLNPILFGLGKPGCGKTITAHAVGNAFLDFCKAREIPAKFVVIQKTDWASSYQNASALNLVKIFREEIYDFEGVCGVYWPDIDTAFASRESGQLRSEEKQNLGAVFGIFDGTLLPKDGRWFLICDANTLHMDEATVSRIAQNPMTVEGPTKPAHYMRLLRELMLKDIARFLQLEEACWETLGARCCELELSGRNIEAIANNIRARVQDFEYPEAYFTADATERARIIESCCNRLKLEDVAGFVEDWASWRQDATAQAEEEQFEREVSSLVRRLNATRIASALMTQD